LIMSIPGISARRVMAELYVQGENTLSRATRKVIRKRLPEGGALADKDGKLIQIGKEKVEEACTPSITNFIQQQIKRLQNAKGDIGKVVDDILGQFQSRFGAKKANTQNIRKIFEDMGRINRTQFSVKEVESSPGVLKAAFQGAEPVKVKTKDGKENIVSYTITQSRQRYNALVSTAKKNATDKITKTVDRTQEQQLLKEYTSDYAKHLIKNDPQEAVKFMKSAANGGTDKQLFDKLKYQKDPKDPNKFLVVDGKKVYQNKNLQRAEELLEQKEKANVLRKSIRDLEKQLKNGNSNSAVSLTHKREELAAVEAKIAKDEKQLNKSKLKNADADVPENPAPTEPETPRNPANPENPPVEPNKPPSPGAEPTGTGSTASTAAQAKVTAAEKKLADAKAANKPADEVTKLEAELKTAQEEAAKLETSAADTSKGAAETASNDDPKKGISAWWLTALIPAGLAGYFLGGSGSSSEQRTDKPRYA
jgi:hypothetical protein